MELGHEPIVAVGRAGAFTEALDVKQIRFHVLGWSSRFVGTAQTADAPELLLRMPDFAHAAAALRHYVKRVRPDVVQAHTRKAQLAATLALWDVKVPLIWHVRDDLPTRTPLRALLALAMKRADHAVALSYWLSRSYVSRHALPKSGRIGIVPSGVDAAPLSRLPTPWLDGGRPPIVGFVGQIARWKAPHLLIDAAERCRHDSASFRIIGGVTFPAAEHEYGCWLRDRLSWSPARDRIQWLAPTREPAEAFAQLDVFVHTSVAPEPFGRVLVEAMVARRPIIALRKGSAIELLDDETAVFADSEDGEAIASAIASVIDDRSAAQERVERAALKAANYDPLFVAARMDGEYAQLAGTSRTKNRSG